MHRATAAEAAEADQLCTGARLRLGPDDPCPAPTRILVRKPGSNSQPVVAPEGPGLLVAGAPCRGAERGHRAALGLLGCERPEGVGAEGWGVGG